MDLGLKPIGVVFCTHLKSSGRNSRHGLVSHRLTPALVLALPFVLALALVFVFVLVLVLVWSRERGYDQVIDVGGHSSHIFGLFPILVRTSNHNGTDRSHRFGCVLFKR